ncbi:MAG: CHAT domain-containing protein, partial [Cyanobacteria bacterium J06639_16]
RLPSQASPTQASPTDSVCAVAQTSIPAELVQGGVDAYGEGHYRAAIACWQNALAAYSDGDRNSEQTAIIQTNLAKAHQQLGQTETALSYLNNAADIYHELAMLARAGRIQTEQAQIYTNLGQYRRAIALLCSPPDADVEAETITLEAIIQNCTADGAYPIAVAAQDLEGEVAALGSLGDAYRLKGDYQVALAVLSEGLRLARQDAALATYQIPMLNSLGNTYGRRALVNYQRAESAENLTFSRSAQSFRAEGDGQFQTAIAHLNEALTLAQHHNDLVGEIRTHLNLLKLYRRGVSGSNLAPTQQRLSQLLLQVPESRETAYAAIALAKSYQQDLAPFSCFIAGSEAQVQTWLEKAQDIAVNINDFRAQSFATGQLGHLDECRGETFLARALDLSQKAEWQASEALTSADSEYLWQWQAGRIYETQGELTKALETYNQAIKTLETIRDDILTAAQDLQFDFRDSVEPLYRTMIKLQLQLVEETTVLKQFDETTTDSQDVLLESLDGVLNTADALKLAELQNYFGDDCLLSPLQQERVVGLVNQNSTSAVISSIIFDERTALILNLPDASPELAWIETDNEILRQTVNQYLEGLEKSYDLTYDNNFAKQLYQWIIKPFEIELQNAQVDTLVFIQDGILRSIPMAALWDGNQYLIEKFAIATTPSLTLTDPKPLNPEGLSVLTVGLSERVCEQVGNRCYDPLPNVPNEVAQVSGTFSGSPQPLLNEAFTRNNLATALAGNSYPILHIATHGQFSADPDNTFIVTGEGERLTFGALEALIRENSSNTGPIELITLTACETGVGDDRSTLGLAGVAIRAGARSAIASLWLIDDATTAEIISTFYEGLKNSELNKAQALQAAQIAAIQPNANPGNWAPLILVGNWL